MASLPFICGRCARAIRQGASTPLHNPLARRVARHSRLYSKDSSVGAPTNPPRSSPRPQDPAKDASSSGHGEPTEPQPEAPQQPRREPGAMSRRLEEATEDAMLSGGRAGVRAIEAAGFSEELKTRLLNRLSDARADDASALNAAGLPAATGQPRSGVFSATAAAQPWTGEEPTADAVLRMLEDAHRPLRPELRGTPKIPKPRPGPVDMRIRRGPRVSPGDKAAAARDLAVAYAGMGLKDADKAASDKQREAFRKELRERFSPGARAMPNTISGLAALANERIEDAIARGQFKDIPRGKGVERDTRADNPFIDTTEYIMNKMIKRQDIVPPWIEKQQELAKAVRVFRERLRNDWKRHAARMIASHSGSLQDKMRRAAEFARAEEEYNPRRRNVDQIPVPIKTANDSVVANTSKSASVDNTSSPSTKTSSNESQATHFRPFRDPTWQAAERSYMELSVAKLNALTRSYNLMAPELAKKPYFSLERELNNCFADVAPQLANEIKERAARPPKSLTDSVGPGSLGILDRFGNAGSTARVYESKSPHYGFKEMWRDLWNRPG